MGITTHLTFADNIPPPKRTPIDVLYHGSINSKIKVLESQQEYVRDLAEGAVIFATPSIKIASPY